MKAENYESLYIVKMPNNFCGIGAMMLNHPKNVRLFFEKTIQEILVTSWYDLTVKTIFMKTVAHFSFPNADLSV